MNGLEIAIIGMAGRFPGADNIEKFWENLRDGVESVSTLSDEELEKNGVEKELLQHPDYIKVAATLENVEEFDAEFFGFSPREAEILDPQQRLFLECAWSALENAGYNPQVYAGAIGVYAGSAMNSYLFNLLSNPDIQNNVSRYQLFLANDKDFLTTRVSYKLNLRGPSVDIQTACSTSLVTVHMACQSLLSGECDIALAGGVSWARPTGYLYQEGGIYSPDGHCRAFDADAQGTISGSGLGIVVLKRLQDALDDNDYIHAVIKGSAINNDGALKVSYTAPRIDTQAAVIRTAFAVAEVNPETISYIEAHGTGTALGDPIEIAALTQAFDSKTQNKSCAIGSVKSNIGHLDTAAGIASLIKTVLALQHKQLPPSLHFLSPNPQIDFDKSPFYVNTSLTDWNSQTPRRAGVSSFGIGGTNAHVILEEAPTLTPSSPSRPYQLLLLSAKTLSALKATKNNLAHHLQQLQRLQPLNLADVAYTLHGRQAFEHRCVVVCQTTQEAAEILASDVLSQVASGERKVMTFLFPGQGSQYVNMGKDLYESEPVFRGEVDRCCELLISYLNLDLRSLLYIDIIPPTPLSKGGFDPSLVPPLLRGVRGDQISQTTYAQPTLFVVEYALAQLLKSWGIEPQAMIGHSIGEYVAATLAGVFTLEDALKLVATRGKLMQQCPSGAMLSVAVSADVLQPQLLGSLVIAANNAPQLCVVSGSEAEISSFEKYLDAENISYRRLQTSHAFHSPLMDEIIPAFIAAFSNINLQAPQIPFISNVTGDWIKPEQATDPNYWATHLRQAVQFANGITKLIEEPNRIFLEVGPGRTLSTLTKQQTNHHTILSSLRHPQDSMEDIAFLLQTLGKLWLEGVFINWSGYYAHERRQKLPLPTYSFQRQRYWVDAKTVNTAYPKLDSWFYIPSWERSLPRETTDLAEQKQCWLVMADNYGVGVEIIKILKSAGDDVIIVNKGEKYDQPAYRTFTVNPENPQDFTDLWEDLELRELLPNYILYLWSIGAEENAPHNDIAFLQRLQNISTHITFITNQTQPVLGNEEINSLSATVVGMSKVISQENPSLTCRCVDIVLPNDAKTCTRVAEQIITETLTNTTDTVVAYRGKHRWQQVFKGATINTLSPLRSEGTYIIVGDLTTGLGSVYAEYIPKIPARLVLISDDIPETLKQSANMFINIDITDKQQLQQAITSVEEKYGQIHGVFYSTPMSNENSMALLSRLAPFHWEYNYRTKIQPLFALAEVLQNKPLDFVILQSSLSSVLGGLGLAAYAAANTVIDTFAAQQNQTSNFPWISINWDACRSDEETDINNGFAANLAALALTPQEVWDATCKIIQALPESVVVSKANLDERIEQWVTTKPVNGASIESHTRPNLGVEYVSPRNEIEQAIAEIWSDLLGISPIGIYDSFFDLGGHSLMAIQSISRLRDRFGVELSMRNLLYEAPTIAGIAAFIESQSQQGDLEEMNALLEEIQSLSPEEIAQQLAG
jgi:acyl transferase domain-containing protein/acyl carrier protein